MILELIPMPEPFSTEWMALLGYESAERGKRKCRHDNYNLTRRRNASGKCDLKATEEPNGKP